MSSAGWSWTIPEPQDRIDFIFYKGPLLKPVQSYTYQGHTVNLLNNCDLTRPTQFQEPKKMREFSDTYSKHK
ncbi:unnamed protein product [Gongylonema pulchrum]|uniref:Ovule protein n=1 Tax=Gongylonema pulchrum TaxID=637853 RepID=A0A183DXR8_9BILA|nr:unnamed protein product [Gongylonema pulchrum]